MPMPARGHLSGELATGTCVLVEQSSPVAVFPPRAKVPGQGIQMGAIPKSKS